MNPKSEHAPRVEIVKSSGEAFDLPRTSIPRAASMRPRGAWRSSPTLGGLQGREAYGNGSVIGKKPVFRRGGESGRTSFVPIRENLDF